MVQIQKRKKNKWKGKETKEIIFSGVKIAGFVEQADASCGVVLPPLELWKMGGDAIEIPSASDTDILQTVDGGTKTRMQDPKGEENYERNQA